MAEILDYHWITAVEWFMVRQRKGIKLSVAGSPQSYNGVYQNLSCYHCTYPADNNTPSFV